LNNGKAAAMALDPELKGMLANAGFPGFSG
jgi:hypothetical protein